MVKRKKIAIHYSIREKLGIPNELNDKDALKKWKEVSRIVCKPCWELKYCPYGPFVEHSPLLPPLRKVAIAHQDYLKKCLANGKFDDGKLLDDQRRKNFLASIENFNPEKYPEEIPEEIDEMQCTVFGHICPIVFVGEGFTETSEKRRKGRYIPFKIKMRVVRRDNYTCQHCGKHLKDDDVEFDHIIPVTKGGSSEEQNVRLTCFECNRDKSDKVVL